MRSPVTRGAIIFRYSLVGWDTRLSPARPGFDVPVTEGGNVWGAGAGWGAEVAGAAQGRPVGSINAENGGRLGIGCSLPIHGKF